MLKTDKLNSPTPKTIREKLGVLPWMTLEQGEAITRFILTNRLKHVLELGFYHGVSTCYLAAAVSHMDGGSVMTIDKLKVRKLDPNILQLLELFGLAPRVTAYFEPTSYIWRLVRLLEEDPRPRFDLCYIDGAHQLAVDGVAFFLADRLLRPGGWMIFDDLDWTVASRPDILHEDWVTRLTEEERTTPQIRKLYELMVKTHPHYDQFRTEGGWAFARKRGDLGPLPEVRTETVVKPVLMTKEMFLQHMKNRDRHS